MPGPSPGGIGLKFRSDAQDVRSVLKSKQAKIEPQNVENPILDVTSKSRRGTNEGTSEEITCKGCARRFEVVQLSKLHFLETSGVET